MTRSQQSMTEIWLNENVQTEIICKNSWINHHFQTFLWDFCFLLAVYIDMKQKMFTYNTCLLVCMSKRFSLDNYGFEVLNATFVIYFKTITHK